MSNFGMTGTMVTCDVTHALASLNSNLSGHDSFTLDFYISLALSQNSRRTNASITQTVNGFKGTHNTWN